MVNLNEETQQDDTTAASDDQAAIDNPNPLYFIDKNSLKESGMSHQYMVYSRLCRQGTCKLCQKYAPDAVVAPMPSVSELTRFVTSHCFKQEGYPNPQTSLLEIVFLLLVRKNKPLNLDEIEKKLLEIWKDNVYIKNRSRSNIMKTLDGPNNYAITRYLQ